MATDQYTEKETKRRRDNAVRMALNTPRTPHQVKHKPSTKSERLTLAKAKEKPGR